ncbi:hypothetical protein AVEN_208836-1 [Araneus ventricosus]|uniref:Uncharacterized protein n=1 Tax=Araneus ventricosus TaxID=182803 RepID=A0A4Y2KFW6_ARAVE|nr:hypothetical protein AVEN_208836-1 [Araneus ventricosus]
MGAEGPHSDRKSARIAIGLGRLMRYEREGNDFLFGMITGYETRVQNFTPVYCHSCSLVTFGTHLHLSPALKSARSGRHFRSNEEVRQDVRSFLRSLGTDFYKEGFSKLISRYGKTRRLICVKIANILYFVIPLYVSDCIKAPL